MQPLLEVFRANSTISLPSPTSSPLCAHPCYFYRHIWNEVEAKIESGGAWATLPSCSSRSSPYGAQVTTVSIEITFVDISTDSYLIWSFGSGNVAALHLPCLPRTKFPPFASQNPEAS
uniref:Uncharacterized protein n=1 Tax=Oryza punctata TaxID=4537 RepID=A0A0E0L234_ORYPU